MKYEDICITPPPEDSGQYYNPACRTYFVQRDEDGATLHPVQGHTVSRRTGNLISVCVAFGLVSPQKLDIRRIAADSLVRGDIIETPWPPSQDAVRLRWLCDWQYSSVAAAEIQHNRLPAHYSM